MNITITPAPLSGTVAAPISKSSLHRLMICAALAKEPSRILYSGRLSEDISATVRCLRGLGATVTEFEGGADITPFDPGAPVSDCLLDCGESGSTLRFLIPVAAALGGVRRFLLRGRLPERPLSPLIEVLQSHGARIILEGNVLSVCGDGLSGGEFEIDGGVSSQFISGLLFALPLIPQKGYVKVTGDLQSRPYIDMTLSSLRLYGMVTEEKGSAFYPSPDLLPTPKVTSAEGDWSGAAFWVFAGALSRKGIRITGLDPKSLQGDRACVSLVRQMGAVVTELDDGVLVRKGKLLGISADASHIPDLVPILAAVASAAEGDTLISGVSRLRLKESDRIASTCGMIRDLGRRAAGDSEAIRVFGGNATLSPSYTADSAKDHRIAMAAAVLSCLSPAPVTVLDSECTHKSYPDFWRDFVSLGGQISTEAQPLPNT